MTRQRIMRFSLLAAALGLVAFGLPAASPATAVAAPAIKVTTQAPDYVTPGGGFALTINVRSTGDQPLDGPLNLRLGMPEGILPVPVGSLSQGIEILCPPATQDMECTVVLNGVKAGEPGAQLRFELRTTVDSSATGPLLGGLIEVSGGGTPGSFVHPLPVTAGLIGPFAIDVFDVQMDPTPAGLPSAQAGADPTEVRTRIEPVNEASSYFGDPSFGATIVAPPEQFRDVVTHIPPGFIGAPTATPARCTLAELNSPLAGEFGVPSCSPQSQVGVAEINTGDIVGLYNLEPPPGSPAAFGFLYQGVVVALLARVRPSDHGVDLVVKDSVNSVPLPSTEVELWGVPSDSSHDHLRSVCLLGGGGYNAAMEPCGLTNRSGAPFFRTPTSCPGTPLPWEIEMNTWQNRGRWVSKETETEPTVGCDKLPFTPEVSMAPSDSKAGSPSGLEVGIAMPQDRTAAGFAQADLRSATVRLPEGVTINPASADGLAACTDAQLRLEQEGPSNCPDAAKLGSLELTSPLLEDPIGGSVYLRSQASDDPGSGDLFRLALEIRDDRYGIAIRLPGSLVVDEETGQLTTRFEDLPQLPFETMQLHLKTGPRAPLSLPASCGTYTADVRLEGWNGKVDTSSPRFDVDDNCSPVAFSPGFEAGATDSTAGEFAPFELRVTRGAGQPNVSRIDATLPEGLVAKLAGVGVCAGTQAQSGECPAASRIGSVVAGIGEGSSPLFLPQAGKAPTAVYFAGPYNGAPYSIVARVPAQAGPFDLGQVLVRSAVRIDPETVQVTVASDPLPQIYQGVPVSYRDVRIRIDRPEYTLNPTDCEPTAVSGMISSVEGQTAAVSSRFQVADCAALGFKPKLSIRLRGKTRRTGNPALTAVLKMPQGGANIARTSVALPSSEFLAQSHLGTSCTRVEYSAGAGGGAGCPAGSVYGRARAFSPLLDRPLEGPVYLRSNGGARELPDLVASLDGQIHVDLVGYIDSNKHTGGLRTTFAKVPDAPVSKFVLKMPGGKKSLLENSTNICRGKHRAIVRMDAQNGRIHDFRPLVRASCGKAGRKR